MLTYYEANRQQRHVYDLGIENFRVLTVTTDKPRIEKMLAALNVITAAKARICSCSWISDARGKQSA